MKKECKLVTINDGQAKVLSVGNFLRVSEYCTAEGIINEYLNDGWIVKSINTDYSPSINEPGVWTFTKDGIVIYLEREIDETGDK